MSVTTNHPPPPPPLTHHNHNHNHHNRDIGLSEFVAQPEKRHVPNHLLDTKIFSGVCDNELFHCRPTSIHFKGFRATTTTTTGGNRSTRYTQKLKIINVSSECQRVHVIPPSSSEFKIKYSKVDTLVPGMYLDVVVEFLPRENVYHYDCIRVHCKGSGNNNLTVPIHAYLTMDLSTFPSNVHFKPTLVGHSSVKKFPLKNDAAVDFEFEISFLENHCAFDIVPLCGAVPAGGEVEVVITYSPIEYCTACANIQLSVSQFNCQPHHCYITGTCEPGLASKLKVKQIESLLPRETVDPKRLSPLYRSQQARKQTDTTGKSVLKKNGEPREIIVQDGVRFPADMNGHSAVSYVLSQKAGKLKAKDLKDVVHKGTGASTSNNGYTSKQMKEAVFEHLVSKNIDEEERNQLRWGVKLGDCAMSKLHHDDVLKQRHRTGHEYLLAKGECENADEFRRLGIRREMDRIRRVSNRQSLSQPSFDLFYNDDWQKRQMILGRFVQAARKIIWISRAKKSLKVMSSYLHEWRTGNFKSTRKTTDENNRELDVMSNVTLLDTLGTRLQAFSFPKYTSKTLKDDMAVDALGLVAAKETVVTPKTKVCMYDLEVPLQYKLLHYNTHPHTNAVTTYIHNGLPRKLRNEDESESDESQSCSTPLQIDDLTDEPTMHMVEVDSISKLSIPDYLLEARSYDPMHIFNPMPGVKAHAEALPYREIDDDYALSPLSRAVPKGHGLDRDNIIPGVMNWKKFPVHSLVAMSNTPSLYHVYVPRWSDPFSEELVPVNTPQLMDGLPDNFQADNEDDDDDDTQCTEEDDGAARRRAVIVPTMKMVEVEFTTSQVLEETSESDTQQPLSSSVVPLSLPTSNNPQCALGMTSRDVMQNELNVYVHKQMDNLGRNVRMRVDYVKNKWDLDNVKLNSSI